MSQEVSEPAAQNQLPCRGYRRSCLTAALVAIVLLVVLVYFNIPTPLRISKETTYILEPLMPDGKRVDYVRAITERFYPPEMKTDDNGYRFLVRFFGANAWRRETTEPTIGEILALDLDTLQIYEQLGLEPNEEPTTLLKIKSPLPLLDESDQFQTITFWTLDDYPMLEDWLHENTAGIDLLAEAARKPVFVIPLIRENENASFPRLFPSMSLFLEWAHAVRARATYRLGVGDIEGAVNDIVTLHCLGRHVGKQTTLHALAVGLFMEESATSIGIGSNPEFPPTKEQFTRLVTELNALSPRQPFGKVFEWDRYLILGILQDDY